MESVEEKVGNFIGIITGRAGIISVSDCPDLYRLVSLATNKIVEFGSGEFLPGQRHGVLPREEVYSVRYRTLEGEFFSVPAETFYRKCAPIKMRQIVSYESADSEQ